jgi:arginase family enzyme
MSRLRARCPDCRTLTAVAVGSDYECHSCGRTFAAGLVRVPRAWGEGGASMADAATLPLPYPEAAVVAQESLGEQSLALARALPVRPLVLGGCCCAHVGAIEGLAARHGRVGLVWLDAHGDLNTPESSPSGNLWGMPLRMLLDSGAVRVEDTVLVGARNLDPPESAFIAERGLAQGALCLAAATQGTTGIYVALDADAVDERDLASFMPEPDGMPLAEVESLLRRIAAAASLLGLGLSGLVPDERNVEAVARVCRAVGL